MNSVNPGRREFLIASALIASVLPLRAFAADKPKIGIIGAGGIGGNLGELFAKAGYKVMLSARDLGPVKELAAKIGPNASAGSPQEAAAFGDVVILSVPFAAIPQIGRDYAAQLKGKIVLDTCNPNEGRDGAGWTDENRAMAKEAFTVGTGVVDQKALPGTRLVKAFNVTFAKNLGTDAPHHAGDLVGIPLAGDDKAALETTKQLVRDAGFEPVVVGGLATARQWDTCHPLDKTIKCEGEKFHGPGQTAAELRTQLGVK